MRRTSRDDTRIAAAPLDRIICRSPSMAAVLRDIEKIAPVDVSVLLLGESGTGKELLAQAIHELSSRAKGPFVAINCPAIPETLLESELFGHEKGSFTGAVQQTLGKIESANGGTLFLDEIGDIPQSMQVKLLRFLQNQIIERVGSGRPRQVSVRIVYATNQDLGHQIAEGRFREDLFYRINQVAVRVPPVRERGNDAVLLAHHFLKRFAEEFGSESRAFSPDAVRLIEAYRWPGNVRDIENRVRRAVIMGRGSVITAADLDLAETKSLVNFIDLRHARQRAEAEVLRQALAQTGSNLSQAAKLLGISRPTLYGLLRQHGVGTLGLRREQFSVGVTDRPHGVTEATPGNEAKNRHSRATGGLARDRVFDPQSAFEGRRA
jgi:two-component system NtrC family response regulator